MSAMSNFFRAYQRTDISTIIEFDLFLLDLFPNIGKNSPTFNQATRYIDSLFTSDKTITEKIHDLSELVYQIHREICRQANISIFIDNLPEKTTDTDGESLTISPENVYDTLSSIIPRSSHIIAVIQIAVGFYGICCEPATAQLIATKIHGMKVGNNIISTIQVPT